MALKVPGSEPGLILVWLEVGFVFGMKWLHLYSLSKKGGSEPTTMGQGPFSIHKHLEQNWRMVSGRETGRVESVLMQGETKLKWVW